MQTHEAAQHTSATVQPPAVCVALCVDDYGLHEGVNRAVGELAALGRVQATSAMVGGAAWASGLALLRQLDPAQVQQATALLNTIRAGIEAYGKDHRP